MASADRVWYVNGAFVPADDAVIPVNDLAVQRGYGVFESLRTYGGRPFCFSEHLARLRRSAELVGIPLPWTEADLRMVVERTLRRNDFPESSVRILVTGGQSDGFFNPAGRPGLIVMVMPVRRNPQAYYEKGVKVTTTEMDRFLPEAKTIHYIPGMMAMQEARAVDPEVVEVLFVDRDGQVTEGITSNVFAFYGDNLVTPKEGILYGVTRQLVLDLAREHYAVQEGPLRRQAIYLADEIFITGSVKEVMPVRAVDGRAIGWGGPGERTRQLANLYTEMTTAFAQKSI
jgi:branched-chain amino acid aminotransferase